LSTITYALTVGSEESLLDHQFIAMADHDPDRTPPPRGMPSNSHISPRLILDDPSAVCSLVIHPQVHGYVWSLLSMPHRIRLFSHVGASAHNGSFLCMGCAPMPQCYARREGLGSPYANVLLRSRHINNCPGLTLADGQGLNRRLGQMSAILSYR
jgi:hypothetical protein